jgi:hypothetical protein
MQKKFGIAVVTALLASPLRLKVFLPARNVAPPNAATSAGPLVGWWAAAWSAVSRAELAACWASTKSSLSRVRDTRAPLLLSRQ